MSDCVTFKIYIKCLMMLYLTLFNIDIRIKLTLIDMFKRPLLLNVT